MLKNYLTDVGIPAESSVPLKHSRILQGPYQMSFDITNKCNFHCLHCFNRSGENPIIKNELTDKESIEFAEDLSSIKLFNFCFCGGEPFLRFDLMCKMSKILSRSGSIVSFVSNGSLITKEKAYRLLDSGVTRAQVSLDGAREESYEKLRQVKGSFRKAVNAIKILKQTGFKEINVSFCPTKFNINEVRETYMLAKSLGADSFRVQPLMILGRGLLNRSLIMPSPQQYRELVRTINDLKNEYQNPDNTQIEWGDPVDHLIRFPTVCEHCTTFIGVKADGSIQASPYLPIIVGNIRKHKFTEYWDKGLARMWEIPQVREMAKKVMSVADMGKKHNNMPMVWFEEDIKLDIIDDNLFGGTYDKSKTNF